MAWGTRHTFAILAFFGAGIDYFMRVNLPITIVAMVKTTTTSSEDAVLKESSVCSELSYEDIGNVSRLEQEYSGDFEWTPSEQGMILGSFYYGYIVTQLFGGYLTERFGGKWVVTGSLSIASALNFSFPIVVKYSSTLFSVLRGIQESGMLAALSFVSIYGMTSVWIPKEERNTILTIVFAGAQIGIIVALPTCALIADEFGWEKVFYFSGTISAIIALLWLFLISSYPSNHPRISKEEKEYIESNTGALSGLEQLPRPPYLSIIRSVPMISLIIVQTGAMWGFYIIVTGIPTYLANVQNVDLKANGLLSAIPYVCCFTFTFIWGFLFTILVRKNLMSHSGARKLVTSISLYGQAAGLIFLSYIGCDQVLSILILCFIMGMNSAYCCGMLQNPVDLSPNYAGTLFGIVNAISNSCGFFSPMATGFLTNEAHTFEAWRTVFLLAAAIMVCANTQYVIFSKHEIQSWNTYWLEKPTSEKNKV